MFHEFQSTKLSPAAFYRNRALHATEQLDKEARNKISVNYGQKIMHVDSSTDLSTVERG